jgi:protein-tyrosine-phosphatase
MIFVCTGNTCRSPMAERLMQHLCRSVEGWTFSSAGLFASDGAPANEMAVRALSEKGISLEGHQSSSLPLERMQEADWLIAMTEGHRQLILPHLADSEADKVRTLHSFGTSHPNRDVMDPIGGHLDTYRATRDEIESALTDLILTVIQPTRKS